MALFKFLILALSAVLASLLSSVAGGEVVTACIDCHTLRYFSLYNVTLLDCSKTDLPFCDFSSGACSATPAPECVNPDNFTCISDGYFPDPWNCQAFHLCVDLEPTKYFCDTTSSYYTYNFDVILHRCTSSATCGYKCSGKTGVKVPHPDDPNLFAYCYNGNAVLQDRCPGNYELNAATEKCEAVCHTNGILVDVEDCTKYYRCMNQNSGYYRSHERCPQGQGFNPVTLKCQQGLPGSPGASNSSRLLSD